MDAGFLFSFSLFFVEDGFDLVVGWLVGWMVGWLAGWLVIMLDCSGGGRRGKRELQLELEMVLVFFWEDEIFSSSSSPFFFNIMKSSYVLPESLAFLLLLLILAGHFSQIICQFWPAILLSNGRGAGAWIGVGQSSLHVSLPGFLLFPVGTHMWLIGSIHYVLRGGEMTDFFQFLAHVKACAIPGSSGRDGRYGACEGI